MRKKDEKNMLLDEYDIENLFIKKVDCFGAAFTGTSLAVAAGSATAANLALVGTLVSVAGVVMSGQQAAGQAKFQAGVANNNAIVAQQQATRAAQQAKIDEDDFRRRDSDNFATRNSLFGKTGVDSTTGAPLAVSSDFAAESELSALRVRDQGAVNVNRLQQNVNDARSQAGLFGMKAKSAVTNSAFRAGGQLFSGAGSIKNISTLQGRFNAGR
jgi:hypothetical protein